MELDERITPKEWLIGLQEYKYGENEGKFREVCYMTFKEKKGRKEVINSKRSWSNWSTNSDNPIVVENKFSEGFSLHGINRRHMWGHFNATNRDKLLIKHPLHGYCFEISMGNLLDIIKDCTIIDGVFQRELIVDRKRELITREEYNRRVSELNKEFASEQEMKDTFKALKVKPKDVKVGHVYMDSKGEQWLYLGEYIGTGDWKNGKHHIYHHIKDINKIKPVKTIKSDSLRVKTSRYNLFWEKIELPEPIIDEVPFFISARRDIPRHEADISANFLHTSSIAWYSTVIKSKKSLAKLPDGKSDIDVFKTYTKKHFKIINQAIEEGSFVGDVTEQYERD